MRLVNEIDEEHARPAEHEGQRVEFAPIGKAAELAPVDLELLAR